MCSVFLHCMSLLCHQNLHASNYLDSSSIQGSKHMQACSRDGRSNWLFCWIEITQNFSVLRAIYNISGKDKTLAISVLNPCLRCTLTGGLHDIKHEIFFVCFSERRYTTRYGVIIKWKHRVGSSDALCLWPRRIRCSAWKGKRHTLSMIDNRNF